MEEMKDKQRGRGNEIEGRGCVEKSEEEKKGDN